jgi:O-antigen/teichoic acid export membrane protein
MAAFLISLNTNIPRYFVERGLGEHGLGLFTAMAYVMVIGGVLVTSLGQAASPRLARHYAEGKRREFGRLLGRLAAFAVSLGLALTLCALVAGEPILRLLYGPRFTGRVDVFVWLMAGATAVFLGAALGYGMTAARYFNVQVVVFAGSALALVAACAVLLPRFGLLGAAWAVLAVHAVRALAIVAINRHAVRALGSREV